MMINRINPYSGFVSNNKNNANSTGNTTFKGLVARNLPENLITKANRVADSLTLRARDFDLSGTPCKANIGEFCGADNLCLYIRQGRDTIRYRLPLDSSGKVSPLKELHGEKLPDADSYFGQDIPIGDPAIEQSVPTVEAALRELDN